MKRLLFVMALAVTLAGCGGSDEPERPVLTPAPSASVEPYDTYEALVGREPILTDGPSVKRDEAARLADGRCDATAQGFAAMISSRASLPGFNLEQVYLDDAFLLEAYCPSKVSEFQAGARSYCEAQSAGKLFCLEMIRQE